MRLNTLLIRLSLAGPLYVSNLPILWQWTRQPNIYFWRAHYKKQNTTIISGDPTVISGVFQDYSNLMVFLISLRHLPPHVRAAWQAWHDINNNNIDSQSYCVHICYIYRLISGTATVSMSIYLLTVSNWSLLCFLANCCVMRLNETSYIKSILRSK